MPCTHGLGRNSDLSACRPTHVTTAIGHYIDLRGAASLRRTPLHRQHLNQQSVRGCALVGSLATSPILLPNPKSSIHGDGVRVVDASGVRDAGRGVRVGARRRGAAVADVLRRELPELAEHRAVRDGRRRAEGAADGGLHPPPLLPRLLRPGVRRVRAARRLGDADGGEERESQRQLAARLRGHRRHQGPGGGRLPRHRLLRRHPRHRRARRRQPAERADMDGAARPPGHANSEPVSSQQQPPLPVLQRRHPRLGVRVQGPGLAGPGGAVGRAHDRRGAVRELPLADLQRHQHQRRLRNQAEADLRRAAGRHRRQPGAAGRHELGQVRQRLLQECCVPVRPAPLRPGALRRRRRGRDHVRVRAERRRVRHGLCDGDDQDGRHQPAHRRQRRDPRQLPEAQLDISGSAGCCWWWSSVGDSC